MRIVGPARAMGFIGNESYRDVGEAISAFQANGAEVSVGTPKANVSNLIEIKFSDAALIDKIRDAVESTGAKPLGTPVFSLNDESATKRQARAAAIAKVRADASAYAEALGLRVVRLLRVSDFSAGADAAAGYVEMMRQMNGVGSVPSGQVETMALVWADFALGPK